MATLTRKPKHIHESLQSIAEIRGASAAVSRGLCPNDGRKLLRFADAPALQCPDCDFRIDVLPSTFVDADAGFNRRWHATTGGPLRFAW